MIGGRSEDFINIMGRLVRLSSKFAEKNFLDVVMKGLLLQEQRGRHFIRGRNDMLQEKKIMKLVRGNHAFPLMSKGHRNQGEKTKGIETGGAVITQGVCATINDKGGSC